MVSRYTAKIAQLSHKAKAIRNFRSTNGAYRARNMLYNAMHITLWNTLHNVIVTVRTACIITTSCLYSRYKPLVVIVQAVCCNCTSRLLYKCKGVKYGRENGFGNAGNDFSAKKLREKFGRFAKSTYLCNRLKEARALSSAGLEHLPYKQRVGGSNPSAPTGVGVPHNLSRKCGIFFF